MAKSDGGAASPLQHLVMSEAEGEHGNYCLSCEKAFYSDSPKASLCADCSEWWRVYEIGNIVEVKLPGGWEKGKIYKVLKEYNFSQDDYYEVRGDELITITSARSMKLVSA